MVWIYKCVQWWQTIKNIWQDWSTGRNKIVLMIWGGRGENIDTKFWDTLYISRNTNDSDVLVLQMYIVLPLLYTNEVPIVCTSNMLILVHLLYYCVHLMSLKVHCIYCFKTIFLSLFVTKKYITRQMQYFWCTQLVHLLYYKCIGNSFDTSKTKKLKSILCEGVCFCRLHSKDWFGMCDSFCIRIRETWSSKLNVDFFFLIAWN